MRKFLLTVFLAVLSAAAFALPSPRQIEDALAARDYASARGMVQEVLRERPDSARAHLLNAYLLEHVDRNVGAARAELQTAAGLDKRGDVKGSALFGRVVAEMDAQPAARAVPAVAKPAPAPVPLAVPAPGTMKADHSGSLLVPFLVFLAIVAVIVAVIVMLVRTRRNAVEIVGRRGGYGGGSRAYSDPEPVVPGGGSMAYGYATRSADPGPFVVQPHTIVQPARGGMTAGENFASTAGGVVAGNVLSDMLLHNHRRYEDEPRARRETSADSAYTPAPAPIDPPAPAVDYASERSSFSSSSSGSDSWGSSSSSYDSGSSSSWDSGSSSSDFGSSSGGSDW